MTTSTARAPWLWCLLAAALFGAQAPASKPLLDDSSPLQLAGLLYLGAALFTLPFVWRGGSRALKRRRGNLLRLSGAVLSGGVVGPVLMLLALERAPGGHVALWLNLETAATALLALLFFREPLGARGAIAVVLVTAASVVLAAPDGFSLALPALFALCACLAWGLDNNLTALIDGFTPAESTLVKGLVAGATNLTLGLVVAGGALPSARTLAMGAGIGALCYGASLVLYVAAAQHLGATRSQLAFSTAPYFGLLAAWTLGGERPTAGAAVAAALMAVALVVAARARHGHRHTHRSARHTHWHRHDDGHHAHAHGEGGDVDGWHAHEHVHDELTHDHEHHPDLHHRHEH